MHLFCSHWICIEVKLWIFNELHRLWPYEPPQSWQTGSKGDVILIPGFNGSWTGFRVMANQLNQFGYRIHTIRSLDFNYSSIMTKATIICDYIVKYDLQQVVLIGHSLGGLVARQVVADSLVQPRVKRVFCISTPHQGTQLGYIAMRTARELRPTSPLIQSLSKTDLSKVINIHSRFDYAVIPNRNLQLPKVENFAIPIKGHIAILKAAKTVQFIVSKLKELHTS